LLLNKGETMNEEYDFVNRYRKINCNQKQPILPEDGCKNDKIIPTHRILERHKSERLLKKVSGNLGLGCKLNNTDDLELHCKIYRGKKCVADLYKEWDLKEFRMHDTIKISRLGKGFKERFYKIHEICQKNYVVMFFPPAKTRTDLEVALQMVICEYGFNEDVLEWALAIFDRCRSKIKPFFKAK